MSLLIGKPAPSFVSKAVIHGSHVVDDFSLDAYLEKEYVVLFFYPKDFSPVCPVELQAFERRLSDFQQRNVAVVGCSTDSDYTHLAWLKQSQEEGGIAGVSYPLIADINKTVSEAFGVLGGEHELDEEGEVQVKGEMIAYRGLFILDKQGIIRHQTVNDLTLVRSVEECLRVIDALQHFEQHGEVCPVQV